MSVYKNGSGYHDPTAGEAIRKAEKEMSNYGYGDYMDGDIVEVTNNNGTQYTMILLKCHKGYATALRLTEFGPEENSVNIMAMTPMYTDAGKLQYVYYKNIAKFIKALSDEDFEALKAVVRETLGLSAESSQEPKITQEEIVKYKQELSTEKIKTGHAEARVKELQEQLTRAEAKFELMKELYLEK